jgi:hypothetical protein
MCTAVTVASLAAPNAVNFALNILSIVNNLTFGSNHITLWPDIIPDNTRAHLNPPWRQRRCCYEQMHLDTGTGYFHWPRASLELTVIWPWHFSCNLHRYGVLKCSGNKWMLRCSQSCTHLWASCCPQATCKRKHLESNRMPILRSVALKC